MYCKLMQIWSCLAAVFFSLWTPFKKLFTPKPALKSPLADVTENTEQEEYSTSDIHRKLKHLLSAKYSFRFNVLNEQVEYCEHGEDGTDTPYRLLDRRTLNTMVIDVRDQGVKCWDKDVERLLKSNYISTFHPFHDYMAHLPEWDGQDRIVPLARRVDDSSVWINGFRRWLLALTAQWNGVTERCANALIPLLISPQQGLAKSTFCRLLMPPELSAYYLDKFDLNAQANLELKLGQFGLINLDEFDRYSSKGMATLKNLVQLKRLSVKKSYASYFTSLGRIASFIGTSNQMELLDDPTGSRRFLCVEVKHPIDCSPIDHAQLFAQLKHLIEHGERVWMDKQEEFELQAHNQYFNRLHPEEEVFRSLYRMPRSEAETSLLTTTEIHHNLCLSNPSAMRGINVTQLGRTLTILGLRRVHTKVGTKYAVAMVE